MQQRPLQAQRVFSSACTRHVDKCFKNSRGEKKNVKKAASSVGDSSRSYPLVSLMMSPGWMRLPSSSQTEMAMLPVLSATLHERTSCPSFVFVTRPERQKRGKVSKVKTPHADGNFVKCSIASGPFKKTHELTTCVLRPRCGGQLLTYFQYDENDI